MSKKWRYLRAGLLAAAGTLLFGGAAAAQPEYEISVTNLTRDQQFTPILVVTHKPTVALFNLGQPASSGLATLAEEGNTAPLSTTLAALPTVGEVLTAPGLLGPGETRMITIPRGGNFRRISVAAMLIPTNDAFFAVNKLLAPMGSAPLMVFSPAYDAGSERNDELCASIPGPSFVECGGEGGGGAPGGGEGFVHIHAGIHGIGDITASQRDWRNPVARIVIRRLP